MDLKLNPAVCSSRTLLSSALRSFAGHLEPGDRFPSESFLRREFGISRMTLNRALNDLVKDGTLYFRLGSGRFVAEKNCSRIYFILPLYESRQGELRRRFIMHEFYDRFSLLAKERGVVLTPLAASLTNRRNELDLEVFRKLPDGAKVILPGYWYSGLFELLHSKKCKVAFITPQSSFDFLYEEQLSGWFRMEYDLSGAVVLAMDELRRCGVKRAVLIDDDDHWRSPYQTGFRRSLGADFMPELVIYGAKGGDFGGNTLSDMLKARSRYPFEGIIAASHSIAVKAEDVLRRFKISLPLVLLKEGRSGERISFIRYPEQSVAEKVFDYLAGEDSAAEFEKISPLFCELDSTRNFIK